MNTIEQLRNNRIPVAVITMCQILYTAGLFHGGISDIHPPIIVITSMIFCTIIILTSYLMVIQIVNKYLNGGGRKI